jgi:hypothetical protein
MAIVIKGKFKDREVKVCQWQNDWFSVEIDGEPQILSPTQLRITKEERSKITIQNSGVMHALFEIRPIAENHYIFKRRRVR